MSSCIKYLDKQNGNQAANVATYESIIRRRR
jgi:hypothetical protein